MSYKIIATNNFNRKMRKLNAENRERASRIIRELQSDPYQYKELSGRLKGIRSARFGDHRVLYIVKDDLKSVVLLAVEPRETVYSR